MALFGERSSFGYTNLDEVKVNEKLHDKGMLVGYVRVSTTEQNTARQEVLMNDLGVEKVFIDKASGKNAKRPALKEMMSFVREGDTVVVSEISRFARNTKDLLELIDQLNEKGVKFVSKKEMIDTTTSTGKFMLTIFGAISELERAYIRERQQEGIEIAKRNGKYRGRMPIKVDAVQFENEYTKWKLGGQTAKFTMNKLGLTAPTFYRRVKEYEELQRQKLQVKEKLANGEI